MSTTVSLYRNTYYSKQLISPSQKKRRQLIPCLHTSLQVDLQADLTLPLITFPFSLCLSHSHPFNLQLVQLARAAASYNIYSLITSWWRALTQINTLTFLFVYLQWSKCSFSLHTYCTVLLVSKEGYLAVILNTAHIYSSSSVDTDISIGDIPQLDSSII